MAATSWCLHSSHRQANTLHARNHKSTQRWKHTQHPRGERENCTTAKCRSSFILHCPNRSVWNSIVQAKKMNMHCVTVTKNHNNVSLVGASLHHVWRGSSTTSSKPPQTYNNHIFQKPAPSCCNNHMKP